jgi:hypothetical protein
MNAWIDEIAGLKWPASWSERWRRKDAQMLTCCCCSWPLEMDNTEKSAADGGVKGGGWNDKRLCGCTRARGTTF